MEIDALAEHANSFFVTKERSDGEEFWSLRDRHPEWVKEMVHKAHGTMGPEDYKFSFIVDALDGLGEGRDPEEPELEPDVYNSNLIAWLASHGERTGYVDEAVEQFGGNQGGVMGAIALGQLYEMEEVWGIVVQALRDRLEAIEDGGPEIMVDRFGKRSPKDWSPHR